MQEKQGLAFVQSRATFSVDGQEAKHIGFSVRDVQFNAGLDLGLHAINAGSKPCTVGETTENMAALVVPAWDTAVINVTSIESPPAGSPSVEHMTFEVIK